MVVNIWNEEKGFLSEKGLTASSANGGEKGEKKRQTLLSNVKWNSFWMLRKFLIFTGRKLSLFGCCSLKLFSIQLEEDKRAGGQKRQGQFTMGEKPFWRYHEKQNLGQRVSSYINKGSKYDILKESVKSSEKKHLRANYRHTDNRFQSLWIL